VTDLTIREVLQEQKIKEKTKSIIRICLDENCIRKILASNSFKDERAKERNYPIASNLFLG
jgi:hypothetical protein